MVSHQVVHTWLHMLRTSVPTVGPEVMVLVQIFQSADSYLTGMATTLLFAMIIARYSDLCQFVFASQIGQQWRVRCFGGFHKWMIATKISERSSGVGSPEIFFPSMNVDFT